MPRREDRILKILIKNATRSIMFNRHCAGLVKGGKIYALGINSTRTCINGKAVTSTHAEVDAILNSIKLGIEPSGDIWVIQYTRSGILRTSKPCESCLKVIRQFNITRIFYTDVDGNIEKVKTIDADFTWVSGAQIKHGPNNIVLAV